MTSLLAGDTSASDPDPNVLQIDSEGWVLHGDLNLPPESPARAFALLLHKAAGDRTAYLELADTLASAGIASLRIDLRGHGESTNKGRFDPEVSRYFDKDDPAVVANFELIKAGDRDIVSVLRWLDKQPGFSELPLIMVGSSYTGEEMTEASVAHGFSDMYIALAPGNFSEESIPVIDQSGVPWLFVRADNEMPFFPALFDAIRSGSENAEIWVLPGEGHATDLFNENPDLDDRLLAWINRHLQGNNQ